MKLDIIKKVFPYTLAVMAGYLFLGTAFGIVWVSNGYSGIYAVLMSVFVYAGAMQFVTLDLLSLGFAPFSAALMTLLVNARHLFYGLSFIERYKGTKTRKPYLIFSLTDETYSLVSSVEVPEGVNRHDFYFYVSFLNHLYWVSGTVIGVVFGSVIPFVLKGVDFAMTALFLVIVTEQWEKRGNRVYSSIGLISTAICRIVFGSEWFILASMVVILVALGMLYRKEAVR